MLTYTHPILVTLILKFSWPLYRQAAYNNPDDREPNAEAVVETMMPTEIAAANMDMDIDTRVCGVRATTTSSSTSSPYDCSDDHDYVAPPNVELMVETTEVLEEEGLDWLRYFPQFQPADLEFSDWEADAWDNKFVPV
ncbi:hypothetical protein Syun_009217 [Stephania yunnanensis]|uniref:Uncharacterized protein n=1 Tax=Stephania yunnanensis TaxID=152371 RepID=A0AAP0PNB0_9MAGN